MHAAYALVTPEVLMSRKFSSLSEQFPISRKGVHFLAKRGGWGYSPGTTTNSPQREAYDNSRTKKERL